MAVAEIELNDGRILELEVEDGTTQQQLNELLSSFDSADALVAAFGGEGSKQERTWGEVASDTANDLAASFGIGSNVLLGTGGELYGLATGDKDTFALRQSEKGREYYEDMKSSYLKEREAGLRRKLQAIDDRYRQELGVENLSGNAFREWEKAKTAFIETITDGALLTSFIAEQIPMFTPIGVAGRGGAAVAAAAGLSKKAASKTGKFLAVGTGAAMQGADASSQAYDQLMRLDDEIWESHGRYQMMVADGVDPEVAKHSIAMEASRDVFVQSAIVSGVTNFIPGAMKIEEVLTKIPGGRGRIFNTVLGFGGEAAQESIEEASGKFFANLATKAVNLKQDVFEGVGEAAGQGAVGGIFGGAAGLAQTPVPKKKAGGDFFSDVAAMGEDPGVDPNLIPGVDTQAVAEESVMESVGETQDAGGLPADPVTLDEILVEEERRELEERQKLAADAGGAFDLFEFETEGEMLKLEFQDGSVMRVTPEGLMQVETAQEKQFVADARAESQRAAYEEERRNYELGLNEVANAIIGRASVDEAISVAQEVTKSQPLVQEPDVEAAPEQEMSAEEYNAYMAEEEAKDKALLGSPLRDAMRQLQEANRRDSEFTGAEQQAEAQIERERDEIAFAGEMARGDQRVDPAYPQDTEDRARLRKRLEPYDEASLKQVAEKTGISQDGGKEELLSRIMASKEALDTIKEYGSLEAYEDAIERGKIDEEAVARFESAGFESPRDVYNWATEKGGLDIPVDAPYGDPLKGIDLANVNIQYPAEDGSVIEVNAESYVRKLDKRIDMVKKLAVCISGG